MKVGALASNSDRDHPRAEIELRDRLIVALDVPNHEAAYEFVEMLGETVSFYKIGYHLIFSGGLELAKRLIKGGKKVFLDPKMGDIDQSVAKGVMDIALMDIDFVTVHGNAPTIRAAVEGRRKAVDYRGKCPLKILSVSTLVTSFDEQDLPALGYDPKLSVTEIVSRSVASALNAGCDGVIASGKEAAALRKQVGNRLIVTPGIRSNDVPHHEQKRVATPAQAIAGGADYLVMGRQIINGPNPKKEAESVFDEIRSALRD
jgi:orotidine-5'-phosphate decarboxylase